MLVIVASSIALAAEVRFHPLDKNDTAVCTGSHSLFLSLLFFPHVFQDPVEVDGEWNKFLGKLDYGFTCIFAIEVLLKVRLICII